MRRSAHSAFCFKSLNLFVPLIAALNNANGVLARFPKKVIGMKKKKGASRTWTATDVRDLKLLAKKKIGVAKISKALKRTVGVTAVKAHMLGVSLDTRT
jgi:hypothetical protein